MSGGGMSILLVLVSDLYETHRDVLEMTCVDTSVIEGNRYSFSRTSMTFIPSADILSNTHPHCPIIINNTTTRMKNIHQLHTANYKPTLTGLQPTATTPSTKKNHQHQTTQKIKTQKEKKTY